MAQFLVAISCSCTCTDPWDKNDDLLTSFTGLKACFLGLTSGNASSFLLKQYGYLPLVSILTQQSISKLRLINTWRKVTDHWPFSPYCTTCNCSYLDRRRLGLIIRTTLTESHPFLVSRYRTALCSSSFSFISAFTQVDKENVEF